jgi:hypothetical protein
MVQVSGTQSYKYIPKFVSDREATELGEIITRGSTCLKLARYGCCHFFTFSQPGKIIERNNTFLEVKRY